MQKIKLWLENLPPENDCIVIIEKSSYAANSRLYSLVVPKLITIFKSIPNIHFAIWNSEVTIKEFNDIVKDFQNPSTLSPQLSKLTNFMMRTSNNPNIILITTGDGITPAQYKADQERNLPVSSTCVVYVNSTPPDAKLAYHISLSHTNNLFYVTSSVDFVCPKAPFAMTHKESIFLRTMDEITTLNQFNEAYPSLVLALKATSCHKDKSRLLHDKVILLQKKIINSVSKDSNIDPRELAKILQTGDLNSALRYGSKIIISEQVASQLPAQFNSLLHACGGEQKYTFSFDELRSSSATRAEIIQEIPIETVEDVNPDEPDSPTFICPISYEEEVDPVIIVSKPPKPILFGLTRKTTDTIINNPLNGFVLKPFAQLFSSFIDHPISLKTYRESLKSYPITQSPFTRKPILGLITLGCTPSHVKAANWTLSALTSGGKKLGNFDFWFALLWLCVEDHLIPHLEEILPFIRNQMLFRLRNSFSRASLVGITGYSFTRLELGAACWFALSSPFFENPPLEKFNTIKANLIHIGPLVRICDLIGFKLPEALPIYVKRLRVTFSLMTQEKRTHGLIKSILEGLRQKVLFLDKSKIGNDVQKGEGGIYCIPIDGSPDTQQIQKILEILPVYCRDIPPEDVYGIGLMLDRNLNSSEVPMTIDWKPAQIPPAYNEWPYYTMESIDGLEKCEFCPYTMRPYYYNDPHKTWHENFREVMNLPKPYERSNAPDEIEGRRFNESRYYAQFVKKYKKYPTTEELIVFLYSKHVVNGPMHTLIAPVYELVRDTVEAYEKIVENVKPRTFLERYNNSMSIETRIRIEAQHKPYE